MPSRLFLLGFGVDPEAHATLETLQALGACGAVFHEWQHVRTWTSATLAAKLAQYGFELKFSRTLDLSAVGLFGRLVSLARGLWLRKNVKPHLIGVFTRSRK